MLRVHWKVCRRQVVIETRACLVVAMNSAQGKDRYNSTRANSSANTSEHTNKEDSTRTIDSDNRCHISIDSNWSCRKLTTYLMIVSWQRV